MPFTLTADQHDRIKTWKANLAFPGYVGWNAKVTKALTDITIKDKG